MYTKNVTIGRTLDFTFQPEALLIQKANEYSSEIWIEKEDKKANAKSLLGVLSLGLTAGCILKISAEGEDEVSAVESLEQLVIA